MLIPYVTDMAGRFRMYSATSGQRAQFFNVPIRNFGWAAAVTSPRPAAGSRNLTLPAGAVVIYGNYAIDQCPGSGGYHGYRPRDCSSILTPWNPDEIIVLRYQAQAYSLMELPPTNYLFVDCDAFHPVWGQGSIHGYFPREGAKYLAREVVTFPPDRPLPPPGQPTNQKQKRW